MTYRTRRYCKAKRVQNEDFNSARKPCKGCCIRKDNFIKEGQRKRKWWFGKRIEKSESSGVKSEEVGQ